MNANRLFQDCCSTLKTVLLSVLVSYCIDYQNKGEKENMCEIRANSFSNINILESHSHREGC